jgi:hypothetical protein
MKRQIVTAPAEVSCLESTVSMRSFLIFPEQRPHTWILSSVCFWKRHGQRLRMQDTLGRVLKVADAEST